MAKKQGIKGNTIYNSIKSVAGIIYPLVTFPYISRVLMAENVGKINFGNSVVSYFSLVASLGVTTYAIRECSRVRNDSEKLEDTASQIFSINVFSTIIAYAALVVTLIVARPLANYRTLICIQSTSILFTTLGADWLNTAMEDFRYITLRTVGMQITSLVLMFIFVQRPEDYMKYAIISVVASSGANIINIFYRKKFCTVRFTVKINVKRHLPPIFLLFSMILSQTIYCNSDMTMLGLMRGDYEVGLYSTSVKIYNIVNTLVASVAWVVMPQLSSAFASKDYEKVNRLLKYALNFIIVFGLPCIVGINAITKPLIYVIAGNEYLPASLSLNLLTIALLFSFIGGWIGNMTMLPAGKESICLKTSAISAVVNVVLNIFLIPRWGIYAAAFTTAVAEMVGTMMKIPYMDKNIHIAGLFDMIKAPCIGAMAIVAISALTCRVADSYFVIVISTMAMSVVAYFAILLALRNEFVLGFILPIVKKLKGQK